MPRKPNIALLVDAENINNIASIRLLIEQLQSDGQIVVKRAVGDWNKAIRIVQSEMQSLGFDIVQQTNHVPGRNMADIRLVIEAIDLLNEQTLNIDAFAVVSSDQDFLPLYERLRELGKRVIVAGDSSVNFTRLEQHADLFIPITDDVRDANIDLVHQSTSARKTRKGGVTVAKSRMNQKLRHKVKILILRSMLASVNEHEVVSADLLYKTMRRLNPGFSVKKLGYAQFAQLVRSYPDIVRVRGKRSSNTTVKLLRSPAHS